MIPTQTPVRSGERGERGAEKLTFLTTPSFLAGAFFLVTPAGFAPLTAAATFFLGLLLFLRVVAGAVSTVGKIRGLEWPVWDRVPSRAITPICAVVVLLLWLLGNSFLRRTGVQFCDSDTRPCFSLYSREKYRKISRKHARNNNNAPKNRLSLDEVVAQLAQRKRYKNWSGRDNRTSRKEFQDVGRRMRRGELTRRRRRQKWELISDIYRARRV
jgi:hypothetical protein